VGLFRVSLLRAGLLNVDLLSGAILPDLPGGAIPLDLLLEAGIGIYAQEPWWPDCNTFG
jgi:hypothetical protein